MEHTPSFQKQKRKYQSCLHILPKEEEEEVVVKDQVEEPEVVVVVVVKEKKQNGEEEEEEVQHRPRCSRILRIHPLPHCHQR